MTATTPTAVLLAAGGGSRMAEVTSEPKVLLPIAGRSLLERHICALRELGLRRVLVVVGYQREKVMRAAQSAAKGIEVEFVHNDDYTTFGNGYSLYLGVERAAGAVLVFDGDVVYDVDVLRRFLAGAEESALLVGHGELDDTECAKVLVDGQSFCRMTIDKRPVTPAELAAYRFVGECVGILKFGAGDRQALVDTCRAFFADRGNLLRNWESILNEFLPHRQIPYRLEASRRWIEVDTPDDYHRALELFAT